LQSVLVPDDSIAERLCQGSGARVMIDSFVECDRASPDRGVPDDLKDDLKGRVLRFRLRGSTRPAPMPPPSPVEDLGKFERVDEPDDFRHRMKMNGLAIVATVVLIMIGIWIADTMAQMRKKQDCVLTGRSTCAPVNVPIAPR